MKKIEMVDLRSQYLRLKDEIDEAIAGVLEESAFIRGRQVSLFENELAAYLGSGHVLGVANGTDALQIAMMAAGIAPGDEIITTPFTFVATAEAAALLGATPVFVDIDPSTFNISPAAVEQAISPRSKAIVPVHLFGQAADLDPILNLAKKHDLAVIEDNAQSIGAHYRNQRLGSLGTAGCLSFFPSKNLGAFGDGGAVISDDSGFDEIARMIANHGSKRKYHNEIVGINSRLDTLQAAILRVKLRHLDDFITRRIRAAMRYDQLLGDLEEVIIPHCADYGDHVFHQYTLRVKGGSVTRDRLVTHLDAQGIPTAVYYPLPLHRLPVFEERSRVAGSLSEAERAADEVLSLPMHSELTEDQQEFVASHIQAFFRA
ncbi:MAG: DegT/DnrJ/EryC1/StrS family aminotransferase [Rhodothermales bacterium]